MLKSDRRGRDTGQAHRTPRRAAALSGAPRIEDLEPPARLVHRHMAVAENHGIDIRITATKSIEAPTAGAGIMENRDSLVFQRQRQLCWEHASQMSVIDVAMNRVERRPYRLHVVHHGRGHEVPRMHQGVTFRDQGHAALRKATGTAWHMGVSDDRQDHSMNGLKCDQSGAEDARAGGHMKPPGCTRQASASHAVRSGWAGVRDELEKASVWVSEVHAQSKSKSPWPLNGAELDLDVVPGQMLGRFGGCAGPAKAQIRTAWPHGDLCEV
jgi:hypothetical protein